MPKRIVTGFLSTLLFASVFASIFHVESVQALGTITINADGSVSPSPGPISTTDSVTYTLTSDTICDAGRDGIMVLRDNIVVDGAGYTLQGIETPNSNGIYFSGRNNVTIKNFRITSFSYGIFLTGSSNSNVSGNILDDGGGITIESSSSNNSVAGNVITNNVGLGSIMLFSSFNNTVIGNVISFSGVRGIYLESSSDNNIDKNNLDNGAGVTMLFSSNNNVSGNSITNNGGINLRSSSANSIYVNRVDNGGGITVESSSSGNNIVGNDITNSIGYGGIMLSSSSNIVRGNNLTNNTYGIYLSDSAASNNKFYHNNVVNNTKQVYDYSTDIPGVNSPINSWDNDDEGNYWSDYSGTDPDNNGVGNAPYVVNENNTDFFPLMGMFYSFSTPAGYEIEVVSNSIIDDFHSGINGSIRLTVSNTTATQTQGFGRITIPHGLLPPPYTVTINDTMVPYTTVLENDSVSIICFSYEHSTLDIIVVSEYSSILTLSLLIIAILSVIGVCRTKRRRAGAGRHCVTLTC